MTRWEKGAAAVLIAVGFAVAVYAYKTLTLGAAISPDAGFLPFFLGIGLSILGVAWIVKDGLLSRAVQRSPPAPFFVKGRRLKLLAVLAVVAAYAWLIERVGYLPSTLAFLLVWLFGVERKRWLPAIAISAIGTASLYLLFHFALRVPLPRGAWFDWGVWG